MNTLPGETTLEVSSQSDILPFAEGKRSVARNLLKDSDVCSSSNAYKIMISAI